MPLIYGFADVVMLWVGLVAQCAPTGKEKCDEHAAHYLKIESRSPSSYQPQ